MDGENKRRSENDVKAKRRENIATIFMRFGCGLPQLQERGNEGKNEENRGRQEWQANREGNGESDSLLPRIPEESVRSGSPTARGRRERFGCKT